ncbi:hypothetical protein EDD16DRAFT_1171332 [Pisolithus croceorrhizus]|nr:hypothetical protein EDD16DRAFT_1171332 [Pisolithus croceorrhizus]
MSSAVKLNYSIPPADGSQAFTQTYPDPVTGEWRRNWREDPHFVEIEDIRGKEDNYGLDTAGFQYFRHPAKHTKFTDDEEIKEEYYPESIELIKKLTGASRVVIFDHSVPEREVLTRRTVNLLRTSMSIRPWQRPLRGSTNTFPPATHLLFSAVVFRSSICGAQFLIRRLTGLWQSVTSVALTQKQISCQPK